MLKRLIEVALPLKDVSKQSEREKSIWHGHISTLHIWWAPRGSAVVASRSIRWIPVSPAPTSASAGEQEGASGPRGQEVERVVAGAKSVGSGR